MISSQGIALQPYALVAYGLDAAQPGSVPLLGRRAYDAPDARDQAVPHNTSSAKDSRSRKEDACRKCSRPLWSGAFGIKLFHFVRTGDHALRCRRFTEGRHARFDFISTRKERLPTILTRKGVIVTRIAQPHNIVAIDHTVGDAVA